MAWSNVTHKHWRDRINTLSASKKNRNGVFFLTYQHPQHPPSHDFETKNSQLLEGHQVKREQRHTAAPLPISLIQIRIMVKKKPWDQNQIESTTDCTMWFCKQTSVETRHDSKLRIHHASPWFRVKPVGSLFGHVSARSSTTEIRIDGLCGGLLKFGYSQTNHPF